MLIDSPRITPRDRDHWARLEHLDDALSHDPRLDTMQDKAARELSKAKTGYIGCTWGKDSMVVAHLAAITDSPLPLVWVRLDGLENPDTEPVRDVFLERFPHVRYEEITIPATGVRRWWHPADYKGTDHGPDAGFRLAAARFGGHYVSGVRAEESTTRALTVARNGTHSAGSTRPIARWTGVDVFAYLHKHDLPVHPAYAMTMGGTLDRIQVRVSSIGGVRGTGRHRRVWEETYYPDVIRAAKTREGL